MQKGTNLSLGLKKILTYAIIGTNMYALGNNMFH